MTTLKPLRLTGNMSYLKCIDHKGHLTWQDERRQNQMLVDGQLCTRCNAIVPSSANFCGICGQKLNKRVWSFFDFGNAAATTIRMPDLDQMHRRATTSIASVAEREAKPPHASRRPPTRAQFIVPPSNALSPVSRLSDIAGVALPLFAILLWSLSLRFVDVRHMTDLGLVSVLPTSIIAALIILTLSFCMVLNRQKQR